MRMMLLCGLLLAACTRQLQVGDLTGDGGPQRDAPVDGGVAGDGAAADARDAGAGQDCTGSVGMGGSCDRSSGLVCYQGHCAPVCEVFGIDGGTLCNQWPSNGGTVACCGPDQQCCSVSIHDIQGCQPAAEPCPTPCGENALCRVAQWCAVAYNPLHLPQDDTCDITGWYSQKTCADSCPPEAQCGRECCGASSRCAGSCCVPVRPDGGQGDAAIPDAATD
ncbi:MAG TPA: hypothetical protein VGQ83_35830 [Polyangia bacterium]|jgi:hypothetical protein